MSCSRCEVRDDPERRAGIRGTRAGRHALVVRQACWGCARADCYDARSGALFIYFGKRRDAVKVLFFDGSGMCLFYKRLDRGVFRLPEACALDARHVELDESLLEALLDGVDLGEAPKSAPRRRRVH